MHFIIIKGIVMYEQLLHLDSIRLNFSASGMHALNIVLSFVMFGVALGIKPKTFKEILTKPKSIIIGLVCQLILLPCLTFLLVLTLNDWITPTVAMGMILVAACPGGNISNFISKLSGGNAELSISLTASTTFMASFLTPFNFAFWGGLYVNYLNKRAESTLQVLHIDLFQTFETVIILLGIPLVVGLLVTKYFPKVADRLKKPMNIGSILFFILMVALALGNNFEIFMKHIQYIFLIVLIHNILALTIGYSTSSLFKLPLKDRKTITIETGIQNSGLALVLLFNPKIFPPDMAIGGMLFIAAWWGVWHIISGLSLAFLFRKRTDSPLNSIN